MKYTINISHRGSATDTQGNYFPAVVTLLSPAHKILKPWWKIDRWFTDYTQGNEPPRYPVPAIDYYNSAKPEHLPIGSMMEWSIPVETQLKFRG